MRNLKRVLSLALALVMVLGMMVIGTSAATFAEEEIENVEAVEVMNALGIVKGDGGKFNPDRVLTREEAAKILAYVVLGPKVEDYLTGSESPFTDVKADRWSAKYIAFCKNAEYIHGETETTFNPKGQLTVIGFGKLLLGALGYDTTKYTGSDWANAVKTDMKTAGLDVVEFDTKTLIDRDTACLMALEAMKQPVGESKGWYYNDTTWKTKLGYFPTFIEAFNAAKSVLGDAVDVAKVMEDTTSNTLLSKNYQVTYDNTDVYDDFGRPAVSYTQAVVNDDDIVTLFVDEAVYTTSSKEKAADLVKALAGYKVKVGETAKTIDKVGNTDDVDVVVTWNGFKFDGLNITTLLTADGVEIGEQAPAYTGTTLADFLAYNMNGYTTWEVYANAQKVVTNIVAVETVAAIVTDVEEADVEDGEAIPPETTLSITDAKGKILALNTVETEAFEEGDVVLCTVVYDYDAEAGTYTVATIEKAESVTGKVATYTKEGKYTIGEKVYEISKMAGTTATGDAVVASMSADKKFALDPQGKILVVGEPDGAPSVADPVITDYVYVLASHALVEIEEETSVWTGETTKTYEFTMQLKVLLDDGTVEIWDVPVVQAAENVRVGSTNVKKGQFYYQLASKNATVIALTDGADEPTDLTAEEITSALSTALAATEDKVYTYADKALVVAVAPSVEGDAAMKPAVIVETNSDAINSTSFVVDTDLILNDKTVFILEAQAPATGYVVKTGLAALEVTPDITGAKIIVAYTPAFNEDGTLDAEACTTVATLVFAPGATFAKNTEVASTTDYVLVDDDYTVSKDAQGVEYHTYNVVYADGTTGTIAVKDSDDGDGLAGVYLLMADGSININAGTQAAFKTVKLVSGTTVLFTSGDPMTTTAKTVVVGGELKAGAKAYIVGSGAISLAFIVG